MSAGFVVAAVAVWAALGAYVSFTDLRASVIPRRAVWPAGAAIALLLLIAALGSGELARIGWAAAGAASLAVILEVVYRLRPNWMGFGDVRLIVVNGLVAGWWGLAWSWWALMAGSLAQWPAAAVALARHGRDAKVRWAPGLVVGTAAVVGSRIWAEGPLP